MISYKQLGIIKLCKSAIKGTKEIMPNCFNIDECKDIVASHNLYNIIYYGLKNSKLAIPSYIEQGYFNNVYQLTLLDREYQNISKAFKEHSITYYPLKGIKTRHNYPNINMRVMSDIDILVDKKQYRIIRKTMQKLGFLEYAESDHEYIFKKDIVTVELHKRLIPSYNKDFSKAIDSDFEKELINNDSLYAFIHFAKHYRDSGIGITHLIELGVLDMNLDSNILNKLHLKTFYDNVINLLDCWFKDKEYEDKAAFLTNKLFEYGAYGTKAQQETSIKYRNEFDNDSIKFIRRIIPKTYWMKTKYPLIMKHPILLPFSYVWRIISFPFIKQDKNISYIKNGANKYIEDLKYVGLDNFI